MNNEETGLSEERATGRSEETDKGKLTLRIFGKAMWKHTILSTKCVCVYVCAYTQTQTQAHTHMFELNWSYPT